MSYTKQNFTSGQTLKAAQLNHIEDGIEVLDGNAHTHINKSQLDTYDKTQTELLAAAKSENHIHTNKTQLDTYDKTQSELLAAAKSEIHIHTNKTKLDTYDKTQSELLAAAKEEAEGLASSGVSVSLQGVIAESADGINYTATIPGIDTLTPGIGFLMIPNRSNTDNTAVLNVNSLGDKNIYETQYSDNGTIGISGKSAIRAGVPCLMMYDGYFWRIDRTKYVVSDIYGAVSFTEQSLTDEQKAQARANIGAIAEGEYATIEQLNNAYNDLSATDEAFFNRIKALEDKNSPTRTEWNDGIAGIDTAISNLDQAIGQANENLYNRLIELENRVTIIEQTLNLT